MLKYCVKRVLTAFLSGTLILIVVFCLMRLMPIEGYFSNYDLLTDAQIHSALDKMGLNSPIPVQLSRYLDGILHGDLGVSNRYREGYPISDIIFPKMLISMKFGVTAMLIGMPLGFLLGIAMGHRKKNVVDYLGNAYIIAIQAIPAAVYYIVIQSWGSSLLGVSLLYKRAQPLTMVLPILSLAMPTIAGYAMWIRRFMRDEVTKDYIVMAKAKGIPEHVIARRHIFRNAIVPLIQQLPDSFIMTLAGSIYIESIYSIPGMGGLMIEAVRIQDNTLVQAIVLVYAAAGLLGMLAGDIGLAIADPRVHLVRER